MKKIILAIVAISLLSSCACLKKVSLTKNSSASEHSAAAAVFNDSTSSRASTSVVESQYTVASSSGHEVIVTEVYRFETELPKDSTSGVPPLKEYIRQERHRAASRTENTATNLTAEHQTITEDVSTSEIVAEYSGEEEIQEAHKEERKYRPLLAPALLISGLLLLCCALAILYLRYIGRRF